jgi:hypothetical protein
MATGGVAIVFNAATEFPAMLRDVIGGLPGAAAFVGADVSARAPTGMPEKGPLNRSSSASACRRRRR